MTNSTLSVHHYSVTIPGTDRLSYRALQWLVVAFFGIHNLEQAITYRRYAQDIPRLLETSFPFFDIGPSPSARHVYAALIAITIVPILVVWIATRKGPRRETDLAVLFIQCVVLWSVLIPHVPAAIALRGYAPGVLTAIIVNLPFSAYFFSRSVKEERVTRRALATALIFGPAGLVLAVGGALAIARMLPSIYGV